MAKVKFILNRAGVRELLMCEEMLSVMEEYGNQALAKCDEGYDYTLDVGNGRTRAHANIKANGFKAYYHNLKSNTLIKAIK